MSVIGDIGRVAMSDMFYLKRNILILLSTSVITPLLYLIAFGWGLGDGIEETIDGKTFTYIAYMIPGVVSLTTLTSSFSTVANKLLVQKRFYESFDELMLCPISKTSIIVGKSLLGMIKGMLCAGIMLVLGYFLTDDLEINALLILCMLLSSFTFAFLAVAAGMLMPDLPYMNLFNSFIILPMTFLCGTMFPTDKMPGVAKAIIDYLPLTQASSCIRASALGLEFPWVSAAILFVWLLIFYVLGRYALKVAN
ncbi:ABC-2 type transporter [Thermoplasmatales archaeon BRNA1]|nr:ABC-2 type transporter [Thermoplasmatales archaeon BRNA1]